METTGTSRLTGDPEAAQRTTPIAPWDLVKALSFALRLYMAFSEN